MFQLSNGATKKSNGDIHRLPQTKEVVRRHSRSPADRTRRHTTPTIESPLPLTCSPLPRHRQALRCNEDTADPLPSVCSTRKTSYTLLRQHRQKNIQRLHRSTNSGTRLSEEERQFKVHLLWHAAALFIPCIYCLYAITIYSL